MKLMSDSAVVGEYRYDALGRRVEKVVTGATYRYIYSGVETVSVYTSTGTWKQDYVYGPVIDEVIMLEQADLLDADGDSNTSEPARSWYMKNALGSVMLVEEQDRTEAVTYRYDPYGQVTITRGGTTQTGDPLGQHVTYTGRWRDEETGLYHYRARAYDPVRGRFLQRDPLGLSGSQNLFEYADSTPASARDPLGLATEERRAFRDGKTTWTPTSVRLVEPYEWCCRVRHTTDYLGPVRFNDWCGRGRREFDLRNKHNLDSYFQDLKNPPSASDDCIKIWGTIQWQQYIAMTEKYLVTETRSLIEEGKRGINRIEVPGILKAAGWAARIPAVTRGAAKMLGWAFMAIELVNLFARPPSPAVWGDWHEVPGSRRLQGSMGGQRWEGEFLEAGRARVPCPASAPPCPDWAAGGRVEAVLPSEPSDKARSGPWR